MERNMGRRRNRRGLEDDIREREEEEEIMGKEEKEEYSIRYNV